MNWIPPKGSLLRKRMTVMSVALGVVFGGIIAFNVIKGFLISRFFASYEPPAVTVSSVTATLQTFEPSLSAVGNFEAINGVDVNSQAAGTIVEIHFDSGQYAEKNAPLLTIDDSVEQATQKSNQSELALQEINYKRQLDLVKRGATPSSAVDEARAKLLQAQAAVEKTAALIRQKHITAPFAGKLGIRQVNIGQYVTPGQTSIVNLESLDPLYLSFYLPEQLLEHLHINQRIMFSVVQNPDLLFEGKITAINSKVDTNTHNIQVQATLPNCPISAVNDPRHSPLVKTESIPLSDKLLVKCNSEKNLKNPSEPLNFIPGMFASIEVEQPAMSKVVILPSTAISYSLYGNSVYLIEKNKEGKKDHDGKDILVVNRVFVSTGYQQGNNTVIEKGVAANQLVVSSGELKLQNGTRVVINNNVVLNNSANPAVLGQ